MKQFIFLTFLFCCILIANLISAQNTACAQSAKPIQTSSREKQNSLRKPLSLKDCINIAIAENPELKEAFYAFKTQKAKTGEARSALYPNVSLFYNYTRQQSPLGPLVSTSFGKFREEPLLLNYYRDGAELNQLIWDGEHTISLIKAQKAIAQSYYEQYARLIQTTAYETAEDFYGVLTSQKLVSVAEENLKDSKENLKLVKAGFKAGLRAKSDVVFAEVPVESARLELTQAVENLKLSKVRLNQVIGLDVRSNLVLKSELKVIPYQIPLSTARKIALKNRDEIKYANNLIESAKEQLNAAQGNFFPTIGGFANYGYTDYGANALPGNLGWDFGLQASWSLFNGNNFHYQVKQAKNQIKQEKAFLRDTKLTVTSDVQQAYLSFRSSKQALNQAEAELEKATVNLKMVRTEYKVGVAQILNLLDAELSYIQAKSDKVTALSNYDLSIAELKYAMGAPIP